MPPTPMNPIVTRSLGATVPALPKAEDRTIIGKASAPAAVVLRNIRRSMRFPFMACLP